MSNLPRTIAVQPRDIEFLQLLLHSRILTLKHAAVLLFGGSKEAAKKRVQKLKVNGFVLERRRKAYEQGVLFLSKKGFECLKRHSALPPECADIPSFSRRGQISELTLQHELEVLDVKIAFYREIPKHENLSIAEFSTWPRLYEFSVKDHEYGRGKVVKPDGFIRIHERDAEGVLWEHMFFLEVDRSTEKLDILAERVRHYNLFYRQGGIAERFGKSAGDYKDFPFRVLVICKSQERMDNLAKAFLQMSTSVLTQVCLTTMTRVTNEPFGPICRSPADYSSNGFCVAKRSFFDS